MLAVRHYLALAGIPYENETGERFDFHALRGQFATALARNGVSLAAARELMRHSTVDLIAKFYTHLRLDDRADAIAKLPDIDKAIESEAAQATGTDDIDAGDHFGNVPRNVPFQDAKTGIFSQSGAILTDAKEAGKTENENLKIAKTAYTVTTKTPLSSSDKGGIGWYPHGDSNPGFQTENL
jgi:hypothetical protein